MRARRRWALGILVCLVLASAAAARDLTSLQGEFWVDYEPMGAGAPAAKPDHDSSIKDLLEEARLIFSAMIYGYDFAYRPSDQARGASESFELKPLGQIPWGDQDMEFRETRSDGTSLFLRVRYFTKPHEESRLLAWTSSHNLDAAGVGGASYFLGVAGKVQAFQQACKEAIRAYVRGVTLNKPERIEGHFILAETPRVMVMSGEYRYQVRLKLRLSMIDAYRTW